MIPNVIVALEPTIIIYVYRCSWLVGSGLGIRSMPIHSRFEHSMYVLLTGNLSVPVAKSTHVNNTMKNSDRLSTRYVPLHSPAPLSSNISAFLDTQHSLSLLLAHDVERLSDHTSLDADLVLFVSLHLTTDPCLDRLHELNITLPDHADTGTLPPSTSCTTDTVDVVVRITREIVVDN